jgi:hypothetical protein
MIQEHNIPKPAEVKSVVTCYEAVVQKLTLRNDFRVSLNGKNIGHFCVAAKICKQYEVSYDQFFLSLHRKHRKLETAGKIVPFHQLSTEFAESVARELRDTRILNSPTGRARVDALQNTGVPLETDKRFQEGLKMIHLGPEFHINPKDPEVIYVYTRQTEELGQADETVETYMKKCGLWKEGYDGKN